MSTHHLLIIEDDVRLAAMVGEYLAQSGFAVTHRADGSSGLAALQEQPVALVILDLMLPDIDGWKCAAASARCRASWRACRC